MLFYITTSLLAQDTSFTKLQIRRTQKIGDAIFPLATLGSIFIFGDKKGAWQFTKGLLVTSAIIYGLKHSINKQRPGMSNENPFPSDHIFHNIS